ncbi:MAG: hypothetical protein HYY01_13085 [Chloroflexi bacterium]|nr:hypothetical protein [Chloroflexota bacterium]
MTDYRLLHQVNRYLAGEIVLEQLEDWLLARWRQLFSLPKSPASELAGTIELGLAEMGDGLITEDEFKDTLIAHLRSTPTAEIVFPEESHTYTSNTSILTEAGLLVNVPAATSLFEVVYT